MPRSRRSRRSSPPSDPPVRPSFDNTELVVDWVNARQDGEVSREVSSEIGIVSILYEACLRLLASISREYVAGQNATHQQKSRLIDSQAALCLFGDGLVDHGELETCLKTDDELRDDLVTLFCSLGSLLLRGVEDRSQNDFPPEKSREDLVSELKGALDKASTIICQSGVEQDGNDDPSSSSDGESESETGQGDARDGGKLIDEDALNSLDDYVTSLLDLRPLLDDVIHDALVRHPKPGTRNENIIFSVTEAARPYVLQVHDKFRNASPFLVEHLGEANWQRYVRVKSKMEAGGVVEDLPELPKSLFQPFSDFRDSGIGSSHAMSTASHTSFQSTDTDASKGRARVPKTPSEVNRGLAFTCFICGKRLSTIRNRIDWKMHVFADLSPYICTFQDCPTMLDTYPTRKLWAEHELTEHRSDMFFECHDCPGTFSVASDFTQHLAQEHQYSSLNHTQMLAVLSAAKKSTPHPVDTYQCPLCHRDGWDSRRSFITHVGKHLEEISLSALPRDVDSGSEADQDESRSSSSTCKDGPDIATKVVKRSHSNPELTTLNHALSYLDQVKAACRHQPEIYDQFLIIMGDIKSWKIDTLEAIRRVLELLSASPELIKNFDYFFPAGYKDFTDVEEPTFPLRDASNDVAEASTSAQPGPEQDFKETMAYVMKVKVSFCSPV
ncbi:hypothetical protein, variant [Cladophialophora immunda]|uniref:C2H2-type domain-containing protein n=1 Tax=Cladophialophora immunda TaxID=569365 RepID=A0A0D2D7P9_9EURO|nr:hypothetical protein, variant [Cladophialophora immunda]KIW31769.1 hypothetical protein, variant [Cladophialophora immunda]